MEDEDDDEDEGENSMGESEDDRDGDVREFDREDDLGDSEIFETLCFFAESLSFDAEFGFDFDFDFDFETGVEGGTEELDEVERRREEDGVDMVSSSNPNGNMYD